MCDDHDLTRSHAGDLRCDGHRRHELSLPEDAAALTAGPAATREDSAPS